jgi:hypothetical protein
MSRCGIAAGGIRGDDAGVLSPSADSGLLLELDLVANVSRNASAHDIALRTTPQARPAGGALGPKSRQHGLPNQRAWIGSLEVREPRVV